MKHERNVRTALSGRGPTCGPHLSAGHSHPGFGRPGWMRATPYWPQCRDLPFANSAPPNSPGSATCRQPGSTATISGGWVDETTPLTPTTARGTARVKAEAEWQAVPGLPLHIFRLAGIYGPGRGPFAKGPQRHRAAASSKTGRSIQPHPRRRHRPSPRRPQSHSPNPGADLQPLRRRPRPAAGRHRHTPRKLLDTCPYQPAIALSKMPIMTPMARSFYAESKRVRNDRIKDPTSNVSPQLYPDLQIGAKGSFGSANLAVDADKTLATNRPYQALAAPRSCRNPQNLSAPWLSISSAFIAALHTCPRAGLIDKRIRQNH